MRDEGAAAENLARVLSAGRLAPDLLLRAPEAVALLGDGDGDGGGSSRAGGPSWSRRSWPRWGARRTPSRRSPRPRVRRRELFRTAAGDIVSSYGTETQPAEPDQGALVDRVGGAVSDLTAATLAGTLRAVVREGWGDTLPTRFAVIGMGRFGGHELGYGSDADVLFVHEPREGVDDREAAEAANRVVAEMRRSCCRSRARIRRCSSTPVCGPRGSPGRWCGH